MLWSAYPDWGLSKHLPGNTTGSNPFLDLLNVLQRQSSQLINGLHFDSTTKALSMVVAQVALQNPTLLLPMVLEMEGKEVEIMMDVILDMLEQLPSTPSSTYSINRSNSNDAVFRAATRILIKNIETNSYLRSRMRSNPLLFCNVPAEIMTPTLVHHLVSECANKGSSSNSSLYELLCNMMKASMEGRYIDHFIRCIVSALHENTETPQDQTAMFLNKSGSRWKITLLNDSTSDNVFLYRDLLIAVAKLMIEMPSSSTPLALLASVVDSQFQMQSGDEHTQRLTRKRICSATAAVIRFAMDQLSVLGKGIANGQSIFSRLAPLLILRRIPRSYYRTVHEAHPVEDELLVDLAEYLSTSLQDHALKNDQRSMAKEEKRLLAELAGHCLPFSSKLCHAGCLFHSICKTSFSDTLLMLRSNSDAFPEDKLHSLYEAKAALYATCHSIPLALDEDDGDALLTDASFVYEALMYQPEQLANEKSNDIQQGVFQNEMMMLQSGCTHFLCVCMDSLSSREAKSMKQINPLIQDVHCSSTEADTDSCSFVEALTKIFDMLKTIITTGQIKWETLYHQVYLLPRPRVEMLQCGVHFPPSTRTAMLNSIVILSQGSQADDNRLNWLAANTLPTLLGWGSKGAIDVDVHHPVCIAAALQVTYTLIARCGSFDWLSQYPSSQSEGDFIGLTIQFALNMFNTSEIKGPGPTINLLRQAALKVILTVVALDEHGLDGHLSPNEIQQAMLALHGAATSEQHSEVRRLACQIITYLHTE